MGAYEDVRRLIELTVKLSPKVERSKLWRRARDKALESAERSDIRRGDFSCIRSVEQSEAETDTRSLDELIAEVLGRPPRYRK
jgi:hypothetical protein